MTWTRLVAADTVLIWEHRDRARTITEMLQYRCFRFMADYHYVVGLAGGYGEVRPIQREDATAFLRRLVTRHANNSWDASLVVLARAHRQRLRHAPGGRA